MTKLILSTGNIVLGGSSIIRKPGAYRSNLELTNSLRSNIVAAQQDYSAAAAAAADALPEELAGNGHVAINGNGTSGHHHGEPGTLTNGHRPHPDVWTSQEGQTLYVPRIDWSLAGLQENPSNYDITVKLFFLPSAPVADRARYADEALGLVRRELGVDRIDLLIASFPDMFFDGECEYEADKRNSMQGDTEAEAATWTFLEELHKRGEVGALGIAEFGTEKLRAFLQRVSVRPAVDQINIHDCCNVPPPLIGLAKSEGVELLVHTDCTDILPKGTLRELLGQGEQGAGVLADSHGGGGDGLKGDLVPQWVVKYTAFIKDRGVIENKGYFAGAGLVDA